MSRLVYMGTPAFAVPPLRTLVKEKYEIVTVLTQPDRPAGRSRAPRASAVKQFALEHDLPVWQPNTLRSPEAIAHLESLSPDVIVVAAYSEILRPKILALPPCGCINIHASLLPRHRGPAPVAATILAGDEETGITLIKMDKGMDTGPVLAQKVLPLKGKERRGELTAQLAQVGAGLLQRILPLWLAGAIPLCVQNEDNATTCNMLRKEDGEVDWSRPAQYIERMIRAYDPWPGAYTSLRGRRLRLWRASVLPGKGRAPGTILVNEGTLQIVTGEGLLALEEVQLEGKRRLCGEIFGRGQRDLAGLRLG